MEPDKTLPQKIEKEAENLRKRNSDSSSEEDKDQDYFPVQRILNKRIKKGKTDYLVKWDNCDESCNSWEPVENLRCDELIQEFENFFESVQIPREKKRSKKQSSNGNCNSKMSNSTTVSKTFEADPSKAERETTENKKDSKIAKN